MPNPEAKSKEKTKIFLDSSVIIAATLSFSGGSFRLIRESIFKDYFLLISNYVLEECIRVLKLKYPEKVFILAMLLDTFSFKIVRNPLPSEVEKLIEVINPEDAPILASAIKYKVNYLITLDKKDFLNFKVLEFTKKHKILILTPQEFLKNK